MLKVRIIPCLLFKDRTIVKSVRFTDFRMVGDPTTSARVFNERNADELVFLDIMASRNGERPNFEVIEDIAKECFMPLGIGGGIRSMEDVDLLFQIGADKIIVNTALFKDPEFIKEIVNKYGSQAVVASIDVRKKDDVYKVYTCSGEEETSHSPESIVRHCEDLEVGEILLTSIDKEGTMEGYDLELVKMVAKMTKLPVIANGGAGKISDIKEVIKDSGADAVCCASIFFWVGESIITIKQELDKDGIPVRMR